MVLHEFEGTVSYQKHFLLVILKTAEEVLKTFVFFKIFVNYLFVNHFMHNWMNALDGIHNVIEEDLRMVCDMTSIEIFGYIG